MGDADVDVFNTAAFRDALRGSMEAQLGRFAWVAHDFDIHPAHALSPTGAEHLHDRLFDRESAGIAGGRRLAASVTIGSLAFCENALKESSAATLDDTFDASDASEVDAESDKRHGDGGRNGEGDSENGARAAKQKRPRLDERPTRPCQRAMVPNAGRAWNHVPRRETVGLAQTHTPGEKPVLVRPAVSTDAEILEAFNAAMAEETEGKQLDQSVLHRGVAAMLEDSARGRYLVAEEEGKVLGALAITAEWSDWRNGWFWWIQSVYVVKEARRRGVYRTLHDAVVSRAREDDQVCGVRLYVENENAAARATYESLGMSETPYRLYEVSFLPS